MNNITSNTRHAASNGFTIVEVMVAVTVTIIVAVGTLGYQYYGIKHNRSAEAQLVATRLGQLVLEDWKSTGGDPDYDPTTLDLGFMTPNPGETGNCLITLDNQTFFVQLIRSDVEQDLVAGVTLTQIRVVTRWRKDFTRGAIVASDPEIKLTTYVRRDGT